MELDRLKEIEAFIDFASKGNQRATLSRRDVSRLREMIKARTIEELLHPVPAEKVPLFSVLVVHTNKYLMSVKGLTRESAALVREAFRQYRMDKKDGVLSIGDMDNEELTLALSEITSLKIMREKGEESNA